MCTAGVVTNMSDHKYAKSIDLPTDQIFANIKNAKLFAIDIGKSLVT